ncbi:MAG: YbgC/FadM family acyl-CoA thioesterase [Pseudomonadota bacterium]|nr:YbgC/FadM family acyl-CoA thioesterase [Pseudomonadota bacterium]
MAYPSEATVKMKHNERVYYEHTDSTEFVYHTNYLKFMERARTEWLDSLGFSQRTLKQKHNIFFVVKTAHINYIKPAKLDDILFLTIRELKTRRASLRIKQDITLEKNQIICQGEFMLACVSSVSSIPVRIPGQILSAISDVS